ncbi:hypothetical protein FA13DRAFT_169647 [Coprinellus micaceus]|uniref:Uncharacterized protein n=1 Tax=Coprinellus micaceus TaxID=71717 RepID=A0A4Y7SHJ4_COPMI|nr:hypothetical protein FA13DRAFT_169647 [Coprinellus micaceus]
MEGLEDSKDRIERQDTKQTAAPEHKLTAGCHPQATPRFSPSYSSATRPSKGPEVLQGDPAPASPTPLPPPLQATVPTPS